MIWFPGFKRFFSDKRGLNTVEVVIILAIVVGIALLFKNQIVGFVKELLDNVPKSDEFKDIGK